MTSLPDSHWENYSYEPRPELDEESPCPYDACPGDGSTWVDMVPCQCEKDRIEALNAKRS